MGLRAEFYLLSGHSLAYPLHMSKSCYILEVSVENAPPEFVDPDPQ
jgi:hypothetical protein